MTRAIIQLPPSGPLPSFSGGTQWLNSAPLSPEDLRGKVVLVSFWTYTCINWLRTLPYIRAWAEKYKDQGLVVIGVHTPEFAFEHNIDNVQQAMHDDDITYPVVVDNSYRIWGAFDNHFWPALYFADAEGRLRYNQFGEGEYEMAERVIQQLLSEAGARKVNDDLVSVTPHGAEVAANWNDVQSPETYLGYGRSLYLATPAPVAIGRRQVYDGKEQLRLNEWTLAGDWTIEEGASVLHEAPGKVSFHFHARDVNMVMGPVMHGAKIRFRVNIDGKSAGAVHGQDVDARGNGTVMQQRLYQLVRQSKPIADHVFEIEFLGSGVAVSAFTFG
jgi:thiol-disulfide isomerase/thioredoxin